MTYPGLPYQVGPPPQTAVGQQVRQSRAGEYPGFYSADSGRWTSVFGGMGGNAPTWGVAAKQITVEQEMAADAHPIEAEDFELGATESQPEVVLRAEEILVTAGSLFPLTFPSDFPLPILEVVEEPGLGATTFPFNFPTLFALPESVDVGLPTDVIGVGGSSATGFPSDTFPLSFPFDFHPWTVSGALPGVFTFVFPYTFQETIQLQLDIFPVAFPVTFQKQDLTPLDNFPLTLPVTFLSVRGT